VVEGIHFEHAFASVAMIDRIHFMMCIGASQGKHAYILDIRKAFHNTIEFDPSKMTYTTFPPFFVEYLRLRWSKHPDLPAVDNDPQAYVVQNFCSMQGQKDAGQKLRHTSLHRSISDHGTFVWKQPESELFLALATNECLVLIDNWAQFLDLKTKLEAICGVTLQDGSTLRFLTLRIIQSPDGISIDQTYHIVETIIEPSLKDQDTYKLLPITSPFPTDSSMEHILYEAPRSRSSSRGTQLRRIHVPLEWCHPPRDHH
jgi:hypothetical protein